MDSDREPSGRRIDDSGRLKRSRRVARTLENFDTQKLSMQTASQNSLQKTAPDGSSSAPAQSNSAAANAGQAAVPASSGTNNAVQESSGSDADRSRPPERPVQSVSPAQKRKNPVAKTIVYADD